MFYVFLLFVSILVMDVDLPTNSCQIRFKNACQKGFRGALKLAAFASGKSEASLEANYTRWCDDGCFEDDAPLAPDEMTEPEIAENECHQLLTTLQNEQALHDPEAPIEADEKELGFEKVPDHEELEQVLQPEASQHSDTTEYLPATLLDALEASGCKFNALLRLTMRLRSERGGVDKKWLTNHRKARQTSRTLNWHQPSGIEPSIFICVLLLSGCQWAC